QAEDGIRDFHVTGVQTCALPIFSPFTIFSGLAVCVGYALLGATWLIMKTDGQLQGRAYRIAINTAVLLIIAIAGVSMFLVSHFEIGRASCRERVWICVSDRSVDK